MGASAPAFSGNAQNQGQAFTEETIAPYYGPGSPQLPDINQMKIRLNQLVQQGTLSPEMAQTFLQQASAYNQIDPRSEQAQYGALSDLQQVVDTRGMDPQSQAALYQLNQQQKAQEQGQRQSILQNAMARGIGGSGLELASQLANQQGSATRGAAQGFQTAADANARRLAAIQGVSNIGGQIQGEEAQKAAAQNAINQFNTQNQQGVQNMNVAARNAAQAQNLAEKQRIADTNTGLSNQQQLYNKGLLQQNFANQMALAGGRSGANAEAAKAAQDRQNAANSFMSSLSVISDRSVKTNIKPFDGSKFLDKITSNQFKYKEPTKFGRGIHIGPMAQDIEKVYKPAVSRTSEGKMIDYAKLAPPALSAMASMHQRIKKLEGK